MAAEWAPTSNAAGRIWIGLGRQQRRAWGILVVMGMVAGASIVNIANGESTRQVFQLGGGSLLGGAIAMIVLQLPRVHLQGLYVSGAALEIRRGVRVECLPWSDINAFDVERRTWRGGAVVVIDRPRHLVLPAPVTARGRLGRWFGDPDFDAKVTFLRSYLPQSNLADAPT